MKLWLITLVLICSGCADLSPRQKAVIGWSSALVVAIVASSASKDHDNTILVPVADPNKPPCTKQPDGSCR